MTPLLIPYKWDPSSSQGYPQNYNNSRMRGLFAQVQNIGVLPCVTLCYSVLPCVTMCYLVFLSVTQCYTV